MKLSFRDSILYAHYTGTQILATEGGTNRMQNLWRTPHSRTRNINRMPHGLQPEREETLSVTHFYEMLSPDSISITDL